MLHLEHLNLVVRDMDETLQFYGAAFPHWRVRTSGSGEWYGTPRNWLHFGDDYQYLAFSDNGQGQMRNLETLDVGLAHFAFVVADIGAITRRLTDAGFDIAIPLNVEPYRKNIYFIDPTGYEVEFVEYLSDLPEERNLSS